MTPSKDAYKMFSVRPMRIEDEQKAIFLEHLINRPEFVARVIAEVEKKLATMTHELIYGYPEERKSHDAK